MVGSVIANSCFLHSPLCHFLVSDSSPLPFSYSRNVLCRRKNSATMVCLQRENSKQSDICSRKASLFTGFSLVPFLGTRAAAVDGYVVGWNRRGRARNPRSIENGDAVQDKAWEVGMLQNEVASSQGIKIRRRPPTGSPIHYVGPFEFRLQNEGNTPCNILEEIIWNKDTEVSKMKEKKPLLMLRKMLDKAPPVRDFVGSLKAAHSRTGLPGLIAEVKKASPSSGVLRDDFDPVQIAKAYEKGGAACLSVLTDEKYFQGSFENLEAIRSSGVQCPLLCKEFVIDAWQIYYARVKGADAILLIAAVLPDLDIKYMTKICKLLGLTALVEVHDEREMDRVLKIEGIELVGINNRDLGTFKVDIGNTKKLLEGERGQRIREKGLTVVGESGLFTPADIAYLQEADVKAVLVGESIIKQTDLCLGITQLFGKDISS